MYNSGGSWEGALPPVPLFLDQTEARRAEKKNWDPHPLISGSGWPSPPSLSEGLDPPLYKAQLLNLVSLRKDIWNQGIFLIDIVFGPIAWQGQLYLWISANINKPNQTNVI